MNRPLQAKIDAWAAWTERDDRPPSRALTCSAMAAAGWPEAAMAAEWRTLLLCAGMDDALSAEAYLAWTALFCEAGARVRARLEERLGPSGVWHRPALGQMPGWGWIVPETKATGARGFWRPPDRAVGDSGDMPVRPAEPGAVAALLLPVLEGNGVAIELLALDPADPSRWWRRTGLADWLGHPLDRWTGDADGVPEKVRLYRHPLDWLTAGGLAWRRRGCALDVRAVLSRHGGRIGFVCDDAAHARAVKRRRDALLRPALPEVGVAQVDVRVEPRHDKNREAA